MNDEEFAWFVEGDQYVVQPRINHMTKWSCTKFCQTDNAVVAASSASSLLISFGVWYFLQPVPFV